MISTQNCITRQCSFQTCAILLTKDCLTWSTKNITYRQISCTTKYITSQLRSNIVLKTYVNRKFWFSKLFACLPACLACSTCFAHLLTDHSHKASKATILCDNNQCPCNVHPQCLVLLLPTFVFMLWSHIGFPHQHWGAYLNATDSSTYTQVTCNFHGRLDNYHVHKNLNWLLAANWVWRPNLVTTYSINLSTMTTTPYW